jgi:transposase
MGEDKHKIADWREGRRLRAWELKQQGWKQSDIARALGVTRGAVSQWIKAAREEGVQGLYRRIAPGPAWKLSAEQRSQLPTLLLRGAEAYGFRGAIWTRERVAEVIRREYGVTLAPSSVGRLLRACGWSRQKPARRARQRNEQAIQTWKEEHWPVVEKKP